MSVKIEVPTFPESITDGTLVAWHKQLGDRVEQDEVIAEIETDKVVFEVPASVDGKMGERLVEVDAKVLSGQVIGALIEGDFSEKEADNAAAESSVPSQNTQTAVDAQTSPAVRKLMSEGNLDSSTVAGSGKNARIIKADVTATLQATSTMATQTPKTAPSVATPPAPVMAGERTETRKHMTRMRARIAERLLYATQSTAMLTTFNEVNMSAVMGLRSRYKDSFAKKHGVKLGFMSFFVKATTQALLAFPDVNASIDGEDLVHYNYCDVGIAVSTEKGLLVPILRDAQALSIAQTEQQIIYFAARAKSGAITIDDLTGGTFSITNGGVFGSMLSTPIVNPPQSAILGMHNIQKRAIVEGDAVVIAPMMYLALSYDHRVIDGKTAVAFLSMIKNLLEDPMRLVIEV